MEKRNRHAQLASMWVATQDLPRSAARASLLRAIESDLNQHDFDATSKACARDSAWPVREKGLSPRATSVRTLGNDLSASPEGIVRTPSVEIALGEAMTRFRK